MEVSSNNLKVIIGQADRWRALKWSTSAFGYVLLCDLDSIFVPIKQNIDLMTQLAELGIQLVSPKQERKPSQQSGCFSFLLLSRDRSDQCFIILFRAGT